MKRSKLVSIFAALVILCTIVSGIIVKNKDSFTRLPGADKPTTIQESKASVTAPKTTQSTTMPVTELTSAPTTQPTTGTTAPEVTVKPTKAVSYTSRKVDWDPVRGAVRYDVYRATSKDGKYTYIGSTKNSEYIDKTAETGKSYFYKVTPKSASATAAPTKAPTSQAPSNAAPAPTSAGSKTGRVTGFEQEMLKRVNAARAAVGAPALSLSSDLTRLSAIRAEELSRRYSQDHRRPDGRAWHTIFDDLTDPSLKNWSLIAENIAYGQKDCKEIMNAWIGSEGHYKNIINPEFTHVGFGCYSKNGTLYWDQLFLK